MLGRCCSLLLPSLDPCGLRDGRDGRGVGKQRFRGGVQLVFQARGYLWAWVGEGVRYEVVDPGGLGVPVACYLAVSYNGYYITLLYPYNHACHTCAGV